MKSNTVYFTEFLIFFLSRSLALTRSSQMPYIMGRKTFPEIFSYLTYFFFAFLFLSQTLKCQICICVCDVGLEAGGWGREFPVENNLGLKVFYLM